MIIAVVGMTGAGKSTVADMLKDRGFGFIRLGQLTLDIVKQRGLEPTEKNEQPIRESLRHKHGMAAFAVLNFEKIDNLHNAGDVVVDGLYSWEEYLEFKKKYNKSCITLAIVASPKIRYRRLSDRKYSPTDDKNMRFRPHTKEEAQKRDKSEIENLNKAGPIAMADYTIKNEDSVPELKKRVNEFAGLYFAKKTH